MAMGRKRKSHTDMPARVYPSKGWWFFVPKNGPWVKLAKLDDKAGALRAYAALVDGLPTVGTVAELLDRYCRDVLPTKAPKTAKDQARQAVVMRSVFGHMPLAKVQATDIAAYLDADPSKVAANRNIALLSHAYTKAIRWGLCQVNPCRGVERNKEKPRDRYVTHEEFVAVLEAAPPVIQVLMGLAYLTGQREGDLIRLRRNATSAEGIAFQQGKTRKKLVVSWTPALAFVIEQASKLPATGIGSLWLVCQLDGKPYSESGIQTAWQKHIRKCHETGLIEERFTFHDIRAKAGSDAKDGRLLGHMDPRTLRRIYMRKAERVAPVN